MNPTLIDWFHLLALLALEIAAIVGAAFLVQSRLASGHWRRTMWQACFLALALLLGCTAAGLMDPWASPAPSKTPVQSEVQAPPVLTAEFLDSVSQRLRELEAAEPSQPSGALAAMSDPAAAIPPAASAAPAGAAASPPSLPTANLASADTPSAVTWPAWIWLAGVGILAARGLLNQWVLWRFTRRSRPVADTALCRQVEALRAGMGMGRLVCLRESALLRSPIAHGWLWPTIVLPAGFARAHPLAQQQVMLVHELAHLMARDPLWHGLAGCLAALAWWHPCVWMAGRQLRGASERAADEASLMVANGPGVLAECLVAMGGKLAGPRLAAGISIEGNRFKSSLGRRVTRLLALTGRPWSPPSRIQPLMVKAFLPLVLVSLIVITTAWAAPQPFMKGQTAMKSIRQSWKQILAAATLSAVLNGDAAGAAEPRTSAPSESPVEPTAAATAAPPIEAAFHAVAGKVAPPAAPRAGASANQLAPPPPIPAPPPLPPGMIIPTTAYPALSEEKSAIQRKLRATVFPEISWDGLPLGDVVRMLATETRKRDPKGEGINFIINETVPLELPAIDPATGLPVAAPEVIAVEAVTIRVAPPIHNVRLIDVLDIIRTIADRPIDYTVQDYGVVFARRHGMDAPQGGPLIVRTFHVEGDKLFLGMESAFGIKPPAGAQQAAAAAEDADIALLEEKLRFAQGEWERAQQLAKDKLVGESELRTSEHEMKMAKLNLEKELQRRSQRPGRAIQPQLFRELFLQLGIRLDPPKSVFYNEHTAIVMVRVAEEEMGLVQAAMETLGGSDTGSAGRIRSAGYGGIPVPAAVPPAPRN